jgi:hypothetical protein
MNPVPVYPPSWTIKQFYLQIGSFGPIFVFVAITLATWLLYLMFRPRPRSDYFACLAATFYPTCLGLLGASLGIVQVFYELGYYGRFGPVDPAAQVGAMMQTLLCLLVGTSMSCVFMPLGVLVILIRKPK